MRNALRRTRPQDNSQFTIHRYVLRYSFCFFSLAFFFLSLSLSKWGSIVKLSDFSGFITLSISVAVDHTMLNQLLSGLLLIY
ncbi:hypothetical protein LWI28_000291 [Acer negundo]|uniref:Uncharacterized protein n=1 Tax=Acer negundo TaxID=4023 RepID=A0AAD5I8M0_ACENE|nr:hypothetical protein LWI28_000291 [Acer negundo]